MDNAKFRAQIERFMSRYGMSARDFGRRALGDPNFVSECRGGRSPRLDTVSVVMTFMKKWAQRKKRAA